MNYAAIIARVATNRYFWILLGVIGVGIALWSTFRPLLYRLLGQVPADAPYSPGGGDVTADFEARASQKVRQLNQAVKDDSWFGSDIRCNTFTEVNGYNDNELVTLHNLYKGRYGITLYADLNSITADGCSTLFDGNQTEKLRNRLVAIALV